jgi:hypothetical protein
MFVSYFVHFDDCCRLSHIPNMYDSLEAFADVRAVEKQVDVCFELHAGYRVDFWTEQHHSL